MKRFAFSKTAIATALIGTCSSVFAATSAQIIVKGEVVPAACSIVIDGGGIFDYGIKTKAQILQANSDALTSQTPLEEKTATFTVDCGQTDTSIGWRILDTMAGTASPDLNGFELFGIRVFGDRKHGLDVINGVPIGQYGVGFDTTTIKLTKGNQTDVAGQAAMSDTDGDTWISSTTGTQLIHGRRWLLQSFRTATTNATVPEPFARATADLHLKAAINQLGLLPDSFSFNGLTTLTLVYLDNNNKPLR